MVSNELENVENMRSLEKRIESHSKTRRNNGSNTTEKSNVRKLKETVPNSEKKRDTPGVWSKVVRLAGEQENTAQKRK